MNLQKHSRPAVTLSVVAFILLSMQSCNKSENLIAKAKTDAAMGSAVARTPVSFSSLRSWVLLGDLPEKDTVTGDVTAGFLSPQSFSINGRGYFFGGYIITSSGMLEEFNQLWEYDTLTNAWIEGPNLPDGLMIQDRGPVLSLRIMRI